MIEFKNSDYLQEHEIFDLEDLVGKSVFFVYPSQGIKEETIRKIEFGKKREWLFSCQSQNKVSELGNTIFLDYEEAHKYQLSKLKEYTQQQREKFLLREYETRIKELTELERLLKKYSDEESRKLPIKNCYTCEYFKKDMLHICSKCMSLDQGKDYSDYSRWKR